MASWKTWIQHAVQLEQHALAMCDAFFDQTDMLWQRQRPSSGGIRKERVLLDAPMHPPEEQDPDPARLDTESSSGSSTSFSDASKQHVSWGDVLESVGQRAQQLIRIVSQKEHKEHLTALNAAQEVSEEEQGTLLRVGGASVAIVAATAGVVLYPPLLAVSAVTLVLISAFVFRTAWHNLRQGKLEANGVNAVIAVGALLHGAFLAASLAIWFSTLLEWLLVRTRHDTRQTVSAVFSQQRRRVWLLQDRLEVLVELSQIQVGDLVVVHAGENVPVDGEIVRGAAALDLHLLTGETFPAEKGPGEKVLAASLVLTGRILIRVERSGTMTSAAQLDSLWRTASHNEETLERQWHTRYERHTPLIMALSILLLPFRGLDGALAALWSIPGQRMVVFAPLSMMTYVQLAAFKGILVRDGAALERLRSVDTVIFDKTGTLTEGEPELIGSFGCKPFGVLEVLRLAAAAEQHQSHPIAQAILKGARMLKLSLPPVEHPEVSVGFGISVRIEGSRVHVGSERYFRTLGLELPPLAHETRARAHARGQTVIYVGRDDQLAGWITLAPRLRPFAAELVAHLKQQGKQVILLTGDHEAPSRYLARQLGIPQVHAQILPQEKSRLVEQLQASGRRVLFVGDGINDVIALKRADVSITFSHASPTAMEAAQVVLMDERLIQILVLMQLSEEMARTVESSRKYAVVPPLISLAGTIVFGWGLAAAVLISQLASPFGYLRVVAPLLRDKVGKNELVKAHPATHVISPPVTE